MGTSSTSLLQQEGCGRVSEEGVQWWLQAGQAWARGQ